MRHALPGLLFCLAVLSGCAAGARAQRHVPVGDLLEDASLARSARERYDKAQALLAQGRTPATLQPAYDALLTSCHDGHAPACALLDAQHKPGTPPRLSDAQKQAAEVQRPRATGRVVLACRLMASGRIDRCLAEEDVGHGVADALGAMLERMEGTPFTFFGKPVDADVTYTVILVGPGSPAQRLQEAEARARAHPGSSAAWLQFVGLLRQVQPDHPALAEALSHALALRPDDPSLLNELSWIKSQAGQHEEAYALAVRLLRHTTGQPGHLDTFAAAAAGVGRCRQAVAAQRRALEGLLRQEPSRAVRAQPAYEQRLADYTQRCTPSVP